jgi:hypothetical protein
VIEDLHAGLRIRHADVDVHAVQALAGGEVAEAFAHPVVARRVDDPAVGSGGRPGTDRHDAGAGPARGIGETGPQLGHRCPEVAQVQHRRSRHLDLTAHVLVLHRALEIVRHLVEDVLDGLHTARLDRIDEQILLLDAERQQIKGPGLLRQFVGDHPRRSTVHERPVPDRERTETTTHRRRGPSRGRPPSAPSPRSWSCGCPYAALRLFRSNHNSKIGEGLRWRPRDRLTP